MDKELKDHKELKVLLAQQLVLVEPKVPKELVVPQEHQEVPKVLKGHKVHKDLLVTLEHPEARRERRDLLDSQVQRREQQELQAAHKVLKDHRVHKVPKVHKGFRVEQVVWDLKGLKGQKQVVPLEHKELEDHRVHKELLVLLQIVDLRKMLNL